VVVDRATVGRGAGRGEGPAVGGAGEATHDDAGVLVGVAEHVLADLGAVAGVADAHEGVLDLVEALAAVARHRDDDVLDVAQILTTLVHRFLA